MRTELSEKLEQGLINLGLNDTEKAKVKEILMGFTYKINDALTLALLNVGHKPS